MTIDRTGTFGKVLLARLRTSPSRPSQNQPLYFAMKVLEKNTIVRLRQVEHVNSERSTLALIQHPFIVNLCVSPRNHGSQLVLTDSESQLLHFSRRTKPLPSSRIRSRRRTLLASSTSWSILSRRNEVLHRESRPRSRTSTSAGYHLSVSLIFFSFYNLLTGGLYSCTVT